MRTARHREGVLEVNHSLSPGIPGSKRFGEGTVFETATQTCAHCCAIVVMNPARTRERGYCRRCDSYICDACQAKECIPFDQVLDMQLLENYRKEQGKLING